MFTSIQSAGRSCYELLASKLSFRSMPQQVEFSACICETDFLGRFVLQMFCYPKMLQDEVDKKLSQDDVVYKGQGTSLEPVCKGDKIWASVLESFILNDEDAENTFGK